MQGIAHGSIDTVASCWFLASDLGGVFSGNIVWVRIIGTPDVEGSPIIHMEGRELHSYPYVRCFVYSKDVHLVDPVDGSDWVREEDLQGGSLFVGLNYPFFLDAPQEPGENAGAMVPVFKPNYLFASHRRCNGGPSLYPDWCRIPVNGGAALGSSLFYDAIGWGQIHDTPIWFVPTLTQDLEADSDSDSE